MIFPQVSENQNCATILPFDCKEEQIERYDPEDYGTLALDAKEFMSGYTFATLDVLNEEMCEEHLKFRDMKDDEKNILCSVTNPIQKAKDKVRLFQRFFVKSMYLMVIINFSKVRPGTPLFCFSTLTGMSFYIPNPINRHIEQGMNHGIFFTFLKIRMDSQRNWIYKTIIDLIENQRSLSARESKGSFIHDQWIYLIIAMFFFLEC